MAARVLGRGYAYLLTAVHHRGEGLGLAPSKLVGVGAHPIVLDTVACAELCDTYDNGHFLHHVPLVETKDDGPVVKMAHLVARAGREVDLPLWEDSSTCGPCHPGKDSHGPPHAVPGGSDSRSGPPSHARVTFVRTGSSPDVPAKTPDGEAATPRRWVLQEHVWTKALPDNR
ncbi:hypothetical protein [Streptomyces sp. NPDC007088]|uniref:hypothetical protein n=1 Tax=Streptomyces sp. NPDC007088 TaxID=3364773 RepID=UPI003686C909